MSLIVATIVLQLITSGLSTNITEEANTNKTKRTIAHQVHNYGENRPVLLYPDNSGSQTGLTGFYSPVTIKPVFDPEVPKQVAAQQVLYEFQQTPTNAVSNVHVNQYYQPISHNNEESPNNQYGYSGQNPQESQNGGNTGPAQFIRNSGAVATPVQHSSFIRHGQNFAQVQFHPSSGPQHIQTHQYVPGKYLYVNGKIIYQPNQNNYQKPGSYVSYAHPPSQQKLAQPYLTHPMAYQRFHPPQVHQMQKITKPMSGPEAAEEQDEEMATEEDNAPVKEREEIEETDEDEEKASYEEGDDGDEGHYFSKYSFDDDEDRGNYRDDDEEEDNERGSSRSIPKKHHSKKAPKPHKYSKSNNYKYSENYSSSSKFEKPMKKGKKSGKSPSKMHYKSVKYSKQSIPRSDKYEGKQSRNVPVVHKHKIFKEKWYVTKSTDDSTPQ
ncbi:PAT1 domain containing protein [Asbolus verrucosus]|uniref:PAT1 domain containing protein n=1 Tax=Asbolus verrucosus TaxID=1661398 RepID=A0A482VFT6_ASBVE|nr:PAT1 domain containing protein [Asbolus verrucosus]